MQKSPTSRSNTSRVTVAAICSAGVAVLLAEARERDLAAATDEQLVVAAAVIVALRRVAAKLHDAAVGVDFDRADRLHEIREPLGERLADSLQLAPRRPRPARPSPDAARLNDTASEFRSTMSQVSCAAESSTATVAGPPLPMFDKFLFKLFLKCS